MNGTQYSVLGALRGTRCSVHGARVAPFLIVVALVGLFASTACGQLSNAGDRAPRTEYRVPFSRVPSTVYRAPKAAELRSAALYGRGEFSTLEARISPASSLLETAVSPDSLEHSRRDPWLAFDKAQHLTFSFLWTLGTQYVVVIKGHLSERQALPISIATSAAVGLAKELYDRYRGPTRYFSRRDAIADAVGILLASGIILIE